MAKVRGAWLIMRVDNLRQTSPTLLDLIGPIISSNFIMRSGKFEMPVLAAPMDAVDIGDVVKLTYFTTDYQLDAFLEGRSAGFADSGMRYERQEGEGWDLLYEDFTG